MKKIFYWCNDIQENSGEGILANKFLKLLKNNYNNYKFINLNRFKKKNNFLYNYIFPFWGVIKIWRYHFKGYLCCYINYLPIWNFLIFLLLPKKTILGPITGTTTKKNLIYKFLVSIGIFVLKNKKGKFLFSHDQFKNSFLNKKKNFFNFLFYKFKINYINQKKKFDLVFYFKKNRNKGNFFLINIVKVISQKYKIAIIGDYFPNYKKKNIKNFGIISRKKANKVISLSKFSLSSRENHYSFFVLDCLSKGLFVFYNKELKINRNLKTNMFLPIDFYNLKKSIKFIDKSLSKKKQKSFFYIKNVNFNDYLAQD